MILSTLNPHSKRQHFLIDFCPQLFELDRIGVQFLFALTFRNPAFYGNRFTVFIYRYKHNHAMGFFLKIRLRHISCIYIHRNVNTSASRMDHIRIDLDDITDINGL